MTPTELLLAILGVPLVLFLPGWLLVRAIAPPEADVVLQAVLGVVASVAITIVLGTALGLVGLFRTGPLLAALVAATAATGAAAWRRARRAQTVGGRGTE